MWELDHKEGWALKNWCFHTLVLEKTLESPLDCKEIKPISPKGNQPWNSMEGLILNLKRQFFGHLMWRAVNGKDPHAGKDWRQEEKGARENEMVGWQHRLSGHETEQTLGDREGQGSLVCCGPWVTKSQTQLSNWTTAKFSDCTTGPGLAAQPWRSSTWLLIQHVNVLHDNSLTLPKAFREL